MNAKRFFGVLASAALLMNLGCGSSPRNQGQDQESALHSAAFDEHAGPAVVVGTVLEAATGKPISGARIQGPGGTQALTDSKGRFELAGLKAGMQGRIVAQSSAGLTGENRLRPLAPGQLEVVIYLR